MARHWLGVLFSAVPFFYLSWMLLNVWREPMSVHEGTWVPYGVGLLAIEFLVLHSGVFLASVIASEMDRKNGCGLLPCCLFSMD
jgi:hypothetical protein